MGGNVVASVGSGAPGGSGDETVADSASVASGATRRNGDA